MGHMHTYILYEIYMPHSYIGISGVYMHTVFTQEYTYVYLLNIYSKS